jgi:hypothetical protein
MPVIYVGNKPVIFIPLLSEIFFAPSVFILTNFVQRSDSRRGGEGGSKKFANFVLREGQQDIAYSRERRAEGVSNISALCKNITEDLPGRYDFYDKF